MNKSELLNWLHEKYRAWQKLLDQVGTAHMNQAGVSGALSVKDMISQMTLWNRWLTARLDAALRGQPEPVPPWPAHLQSHDEINAWSHTFTRGRSPAEVLDASHLAFQHFLKVVESLPNDVKVGRTDPEHYLVWVGDQKFEVGEFFDHFRDDHEPDIRAWLARGKK